jgi:ABC-type multidrug transport system fused ATPase/permease subunit
MPIGSLRRAVTYPDPAESRTSHEIADVLHDVGLDHLVERLDEEGAWDQTLSDGERQRVAFARMFLQGPDIAVMDEATAALILKARTASWKNWFKGRIERRSSVWDIVRNWNLTMIVKLRWSVGAAARSSSVTSVSCPSPA